MKLSDIFSLNLNSKGGAKLYRKIMGKYNIPKQDSKQLVKEIRNSSEGEGVKEWYYTINVQGIYDSVGEEDALILMMSICPNYIVSTTVVGKKFEQAFYSWKDFDISNTKEIIAFRCVENFPAQVASDDKIYFIYGDSYTKLKHIAKLTDTDYEMVLNMISPYISEISKEEYESLIEQPAIILGK